MGMSHPRRRCLQMVCFYGAKFVMPSENDPIGAGKLLRIAKDIVQKRFDEENPGAKRDMMGSFIRHGVTRTEAVSEATLQM